MLEFSRREDWLGMHGRWPTVQNYRVGVTDEGTVTAIELIGYSAMGPYRKNAGASVAQICMPAPIVIVRSRRCIPIGRHQALSARRLSPMVSMASNR